MQVQEERSLPSSLSSSCRTQALCLPRCIHQHGYHQTVLRYVGRARDPFDASLSYAGHGCFSLPPQQEQQPHLPLLLSSQRQQQTSSNDQLNQSSDWSPQPLDIELQSLALGESRAQYSDEQQLIRMLVASTTWHSGFGDDSGPANAVIMYQQQLGLHGVGEFHSIGMPDTIDDDVRPQSQRGRVSVSSDQETNHSRLIVTFFMIPVQGVATLLTNASATTTSSLTPNGKLLFDFAMSCNFIGFLVLLYVLLVGDRLSGSVSRILLGVGYTATSFGFLAAMGVMLQDSIMLWITAVACIVCIPALLSSSLKQRKED